MSELVQNTSQRTILMKDNERMDWLEADHNRLEDIRWYVINENATVREAIDYLTSKQSNDTDWQQDRKDFTGEQS
jgi:hypothetical protein